MDLLKNFGNIQERMKESNARIKAINVTGSAGGDMVKITLSGDMHILDIVISPDAMELGGAEAIQDLVKAAHSDAMARLKDTLSEEINSLGLNMDFMSQD